MDILVLVYLRIDVAADTVDTRYGVPVILMYKEIGSLVPAVNA